MRPWRRVLNSWPRPSDDLTSFLRQLRPCQQALRLRMTRGLHLTRWYFGREAGLGGRHPRRPAQRNSLVRWMQYCKREGVHCQKSHCKRKCKGAEGGFSRGLGCAVLGCVSSARRCALLGCVSSVRGCAVLRWCRHRGSAHQFLLEGRARCGTTEFIGL